MVGKKTKEEFGDIWTLYESQISVFMNKIMSEQTTLIHLYVVCAASLSSWYRVE